jgi:hypothetical protein
VIKVAIAIALFGHGVGHVLFLAPTARLATWADQSGHSWLLAPVVGDGVARAAATLAWSAAIVLFVAASAGLVMNLDWWRAAAVVGALVSALAIATSWGGIAPSNAVIALVVDIIVLVALLVLRWPSAEIAHN